jgi:hypothetical protein
MYMKGATTNRTSKLKKKVNSMPKRVGVMSAIDVSCGAFPTTATRKAGKREKEGKWGDVFEAGVQSEDLQTIETRKRKVVKKYSIHKKEKGN